MNPVQYTVELGSVLGDYLVPFFAFFSTPISTLETYLFSLLPPAIDDSNSYFVASSNKTIPGDGILEDIARKECYNNRYRYFISLQLCHRLSGGKGGFGSTLRTQNKKKPSKSLINSNDLCRTLNGRRVQNIKKQQQVETYINSLPMLKKKLYEEKKKQLLKKINKNPNKLSLTDEEGAKFLRESDEAINDLCTTLDHVIGANDDIEDEDLFSQSDSDSFDREMDDEESECFDDTRDINETGTSQQASVQSNISKGEHLEKSSKPGFMNFFGFDSEHSSGEEEEDEDEDDNDNDSENREGHGHEYQHQHRHRCGRSEKGKSKEPIRKLMAD